MVEKKDADRRKSGKWQDENLAVIFKTSFYFKIKTMAISAGLEINKK